jgi:hypothetical protein
VAVGILAGVEKTWTVGADRVKSIVASGKVEDAVAMPTGSSVHQGRSRSVVKIVGMLAGVAEVDRNWTRS